MGMGVERMNSIHKCTYHMTNFIDRFLIWRLGYDSFSSFSTRLRALVPPFYAPAALLMSMKIPIGTMYIQYLEKKDLFSVVCPVIFRAFSSSIF